MPGFDLGGAVNGAANWTCNAPIIRTIVGNPVFTALLITALAAIVVLSLYHSQVKRAGAKRAVRATLYVFLLVSAVMFVHHYATLRTARDSAAQEGVRNVFSSIQQSRNFGDSSIVPVYPGAEVMGGARPDNIAIEDCSIQDDSLIIRDVVLPVSASPFASQT